MSTRALRVGSLSFVMALFAVTATTWSAEISPLARNKAGGETLVRPDGQKTVGTLRGDATNGFTFLPDESPQPLRLEAGSIVLFDGPEPETAVGFPPFRIELGLGQRVSGRLGTVDERSVRLLDSSLGGPLAVARAGVSAVSQRPGEVLVLQDGFETIEGSRWMELGDPELVEQPRLAGEHSLRIPAGGASMTCRLPEPVGSGRLDVAFHDDGSVAEGQQWFVDLLFRGPSGAETVRAVLGWAEESLSVESPSGPALAVQRLARKSGWHRLSLRFGPSQSRIAVDGNDLAHGKGPGGPLIEIRLASFITGKTAAPEKLAGTFDDLRLVRFTEPIGGLEIDANQDEVRLAGGDQLFGTIGAADGERVKVRVDDKVVSLSWSEVSGLSFRRVARQGQPIEGLIVRLEWNASSGGDPSDLDIIEGALTAVTDGTLTLATPYGPPLLLHRHRRRAMRVQSSGRRILIDPTAHHLGDQISTTPPLIDPPQPEGGVLERVIELANVPPRPAALVLDVVQVVGVANGLPFAPLILKGELRTNVSLNGQPVDYLNRHITSKNETPERIRIPIPAGLLHPGRNVVRFEQVGIASDPTFLDDLGVLGIALEFESEPSASASARPKPE